MPTKTYFVKLRSMAIQQVRAAKVEIYSEHLVFTNAHAVAWQLCSSWIWLSLGTR